jgi:hypothetical protein
MKQCATCKEQNPVTEFYKCVQNKDGLYHECKSCKSEYDRLRNAKNPKIRKGINLQNRYGITLEDKEHMIASQNGKCAICETELDNGKHTCVDHCHKTGKIRKILCKSCNILIGHSKENTEILKKAIQYLSTHQQ